MEVLVRIDRKGRVLIPKHVREVLGIDEGSTLKLRVEEGRIVLEPIGSIASRFYGVFKVERWPEDLDEFIVEAVRSWWRGGT